MIGLLWLVVTILTGQGATSRRVDVEPAVEAYPGQTVNLRCALTDTTGIQLTMVTWIYEPQDGERINIAIFHPMFGPVYPESPVKGRISFSHSSPVLTSPSIQIRDVKKTDEGNYICEYATYPVGNMQGVTQLVILAKPQNSASIVTVNAGTKPAVVARCESVDGRPAAKISWVTTANGNGTMVSTTGADNTVTVTSEYSMIPTAADNGRDISCVVAHRTQTKPESFPMKLVVQYAPQVTIVGYDNNWYVGRTNVVLTCQANSNPTAVSVQWKTMPGLMPSTVQVEDNMLRVLKVDEAVNTTFVCEVRNRIGIGRDTVAVSVRATVQQVVVEPKVSSYPGQTVRLSCALTGIDISQVMWSYESEDGEKRYIALFHPKFEPNYPGSPVKGRVSFSQDPPDLTTPSIQIRDVRMTDEGRYICEYATYPFGIKQGVTSLVMLAPGPQVEVEPLVESYPGQTVNLRCSFTDATGIQLTMVAWLYESKEGIRHHIAVFHPKFEPNYPESPVKGRVSFSQDPPDLTTPSIQIRDVRMTDEGRYICEYATYPFGIKQGVTSLVMLAPGPQVEVEPLVESYPGQTVNLRCSFTDATGIQLTMVTWLYEPKEGIRHHIAVFHPQFQPNYPSSPVQDRVSFSPSPPNLTTPSIQIRDVRMTDEGRYICEYATYPVGSMQGITQLVILDRLFK